MPAVVSALSFVAAAAVAAWSDGGHLIRAAYV
jgi:hypothetical protein